MHRKLTILLLALTALLPMQSLAQHLQAANPVYIAALLLDEPASPDMAKLCEYYGYAAAPAEDGFTVYTRSDGTRIRFRATGDRYNTDPVVEVFTDDSAKSIRKILQELGYRSDSKNSPIFTKGTMLANRFSIATLSGSKTAGTVRFTKRRTR